MRRLLWKEWREHLWWGLLWVAAIVGVSLFTHGQSFCGERVVWTNAWPALPLLLALLNGVGGYAGETKRGRAEFLLSRPLSGGQVLGGKLLFAASVCIGAPLLAALLFRLFGDPAYHPHVTLPHVLAGAWAVAWKHAVVYLFGLGCALVLPGFFGGILTLALVMIAMLVYVMVTGQCIELLSSRIPWFDLRWMDRNIWRIQLIAVVAVWLAVLAAAWPLTRFGLTLTVADRMKRYAIRLLPLLVVFWLSLLLVPGNLVQAALTREETYVTSVSPSGRYALILRALSYNRSGLTEIESARVDVNGWVYLVKLGAANHPMQVMRQADGNNRSDSDTTMLNPVRLKWLPNDIAYTRGAGQLYLLDPAHGTVKRYEFKPDMVGFVTPSPEGRYLLLTLYRYSRSQYEQYERSVIIYDPRTGYRSRRITGQLDYEGRVSLNARWKSRDAIQYWQYYREKFSERKITRTIPLADLFPLHPEGK